MLNSEFNLYKREWLSLVFKNRNQQYGAYELRSHYTNVMARAMAVTFFTVAAFGITVTVISRAKPIVESRPIIHEIRIVQPKDNTIHEAKKEEPVKKQQKVEPAKAAPPVNVQKFVVMRPTDQPITEEPKAIDPNMAVGPAEVKVEGGEKTDNAPISGKGDGPGTGTEKIDNTTYNTGDGLEFMPEPIGGDKAWAKFLQKNLRFPVMAQEQGVSGKSYVSFIIEKDGHLSNFTVERKGGYGFDEEAVRVLKLAAAWKPGKQNGQAVRVKYVIPINFQLAEQ